MQARPSVTDMAFEHERASDGDAEHSSIQEGKAVQKSGCEQGWVGPNTGRRQGFNSAMRCARIRPNTASQISPVEMASEHATLGLGRALLLAPVGLLAVHLALVAGLHVHARHAALHKLVAQGGRGDDRKHAVLLLLLRGWAPRSGLEVSVRCGRLARARRGARAGMWRPCQPASLFTWQTLQALMRSELPA